MLRTHTVHGAFVALLALFGAVLLPALPAHAQIQAQIISFGGRPTVDLTDLAIQSGTPVNFGECSTPAQIDFRFTGVDSSRANLSFFSGTSCDDPDVRTDTTNTSCTDLGISVAIEGLSQVDITVGADELISCDGTSGIDTIWVLALDQPASDVAAAGQFTSFPIAYDFVGPGAPTGLAASNGEAGTALTWTSLGSSILSYEIYRISAGCEDGEPILDPSRATPIATPDGNVSSFDILFPAEDDLGTEYGLAVRAFDQSMNPSEFSSVRCVEKVPVDSFFELYCADGAGSADACTSAGGSCAVSAGRQNEPASAWLLLIGLGALVLRRIR